MVNKKVIGHGVISLLVLVFRGSNAASSFALFQSFDLVCNPPLTTDGSETNNLLSTTASCLTTQPDFACIGVKCNTSLSYCEMIQRSPSNATFHCLRDPNGAEGKIFVKSKLVHTQPELALIDLEQGQIMPASVEGIFPITIPYIGTSKLQAQWWNDIIACSEQSTDCYLWKEETNQWDNFPSLTYVHGQGSMSVIGSKVIVIGGGDIIGSIHGQVEIYDRTQGQWILGPPLAPIRRIHTTVVFNDSLIVVGGYNGNMITSVKILDLHNLSWDDLDDLPIGRCEMPCNVINDNYILCVGGEEPGTMAQTALGLDMSLSNPVWEMKPMYDLEEPVRTGFIFSLNEYLFCMTLSKANYESARILRRMNLTMENPTWEVVASYPDSSFVHVSPYVFTLYKIQT